MSKSKKSSEKVNFSDVQEGDKLTIKWDISVTKIEDLEDYLRPSSERQVKKVSCKIKTGPFKEREGQFIILDDDKVTLHARPPQWKTWWKKVFGKVKRPKKDKPAKKV